MGTPADWKQIFNRYDIAVVNPEKPWHSLAFGIFVQHDQWVKVTKRDLSREGLPLSIGGATENGKAAGAVTNESPVQVVVSNQ